MKQYKNEEVRNQRVDRVAQEVWHILGKALQRRVRDPRVRWATISGVRVSPDLRHAWVSVSLLSDEDPKVVFQALEKVKSFLRTVLAQSLHLYTVPQLHFEHDQTTEKALMIERLITQGL